MAMHEDPEFRWLERGAGEPVVLLHGLMGQMHHWDAVLEAMGDGYRALAPTLPVFHPDLREATVGALERYVLRFLDALDIPRAVLGGNSLGGHVALRLALEHRERVSGLVLTGSSGLFERGFTAGVPHRPDRAWVRRMMQEVFFDPALVTDGWVEDVHRLVTTPASALRILRLARDARRDNLEARLGEIRVPTLLIWGFDDRITPPEVAERFRRPDPGRASLAPLAMRAHPDARAAGSVRGRAGRLARGDEEPAGGCGAPARRRAMIGRAAGAVLDWYGEPPATAARGDLARSGRRPGARATAADRDGARHRVRARPRLPGHPLGGGVSGAGAGARLRGSSGRGSSARLPGKSRSRGLAGAGTG